MSYILEALKKAESERRLGSIPDMHAQPLASAPVAGSPAWRNPLALGALVAALLVAVAAIWFAPWQTVRQTGESASMPPQASSGKVDVDNSRNPGSASPAPTPADSESPQVAQAPAIKDEPAAEPAGTAAEPVRPKVAPKPEAELRQAKKKVEPKVERAPIAAASARAESQKQSAASAAVAAEPRLPGLRDLPENIQREIPALTVGGYIYSSVPAERSVLINNRLLREGSEVTHGLVLEKMLPKEAVLNYKGYRYRVPY